MGSSYNLDISVFAAVDPDVVIELMLRDDAAVIDACFVASFPLMSDWVDFAIAYERSR